MVHYFLFFLRKLIFYLYNVNFVISKRASSNHNYLSQIKYLLNQDLVYVYIVKYIHWLSLGDGIMRLLKSLHVLHVWGQFVN